MIPSRDDQCYVGSMPLYHCLSFDQRFQSLVGREVSEEQKHFPVVQTKDPLCGLRGNVVFESWPAKRDKFDLITGDPVPLLEDDLRVSCLSKDCIGELSNQEVEVCQTYPYEYRCMEPGLESVKKCRVHLANIHNIRE